MIKRGGVREDAYVDDINLAYKLEDGMKIHIPTKNEKENTVNITTSSGVVSNSDTNLEIQNDKNTKVNINTATQTQLETLPGIGPSTATKIIAYRKEKGKFSKIEDVKEVSGIGEAKFNKMKDFICVK